MFPDVLFRVKRELLRGVASNRQFESDHPDHFQGTHGKDSMRPFASKCATFRKIGELSPTHAATDCDCERLEKTGICVWFCVCPFIRYFPYGISTTPARPPD